MPRSSAVILLLLASAASAGDKEGPPVPVFVKEGKSRVADETAQKALRESLGDAINATGKTWTDLDVALRRQHGKKLATWPADAQRDYAVARAAAQRAVFDRLYLPTLPQELADSASDLRKKLADEKGTPLAAGPEAAVWVVTPVGRYNWLMWWCTVLDIAPGHAADPAVALAAMNKVHEAYMKNSMAETREDMQQIGYSGSYHPPTAQEPGLLIGTCGQGMRWKAAAGAMEYHVKELAKEYNAAKR